MQFCCLGSGSKGNTTLVRSAGSLLMVDCGFSGRHVLQRLADKNCDATALSAILVTHEHADHINGVAALSRKLSVPVYATRGTAKTGKLDAVADLRWITPGHTFTVADIDILPVTVPHDAQEPCQFVFHSGGRKLGIVTDLGSISAHVMEAYRSCDALLLEANHDLDLLWQGPYPPSLKQRVASDWGHLNNQQAAGFAEALDLERLTTLVLAHISEQNNCLNRVSQSFAHLQQRIDRIVYATQQDGFDWLAV